MNKFLTISSIIEAFFVLVFIIIVPIYFAWRTPCVTVRGDSMEPAIKDGSTVIYRCMPLEIKRGDIIIFDWKVDGKAEKMIKRVVAVAGDEISSRHGVLYVNGERDETEVMGNTVCVDYTVEENSVFVLGDNRDSSVDSRDFGCVDLKSVVGVVTLD